MILAQAVVLSRVFFEDEHEDYAMTESRKLGYRETIQKVFYDKYRCSGLILQFARISGSLDPDMLRQALSLLQQRHPVLRARFREDSSAYYFDVEDFNQLPPELRLAAVPLKVIERTDYEHCLRLGEEGALRSFDPADKYIWRIVQVRDNNHSDLVFFIHHAISDGLSTTRFVHDIMHLCGILAERKDPLPEVQTLPFLPCTDAMLVRTPPAETAPAEEEGDVSHWRFATQVPIEQRKVRTFFRQIEKDDAVRFQAQCKQQGVSPAVAFTAAILRAAAHWHDSPLRLCLSSGTNLRGRCSPEISLDHFGCFITMTRAAYTLLPGESLWDCARRCQKTLDTAAAVQQRQGFLPRAFHKAFVATTMAQNLADNEKQGIFAGGICYSNLGVLTFPERYGPFLLTDIHSLTTEVSGFYFLYFNTRMLHGRIFCDFAYTEPLVSRQKAEAIAQALVDTIQREGLS